MIYIDLRNILQALSDAELYVRPKKCEFYRRDVKFLGHIIAHNLACSYGSRKSRNC